MENHNYPVNALPRGYRIENFQIVDVLGVGGFGITYLAEDIQLKTKVAIKEYFPTELAVRGSTHTIDSLETIDPSHIQLHPKSTSDQEHYDWGLKRFLEEAQTVAKFKHPNIVQVKYYCTANNTAYFIMDYEEGEALNKLLKPDESVDENEIYKLIMPLLEGLKEVHTAKYLHRDISPSNIYIQDKDDTPILIDFGAARQSLGEKSKTISTIVKVGFAPYEQYQTNGNQGPWSDIYAMGAVLYQLISCSIPVESTERVNAIVNNLPDPLSPATKIGKRKYSKKLLSAIDWALQIREKDRPQNIDEWLTVLKDGKILPPAPSSDKKPKAHWERFKVWYWVSMSIIATIIIGVAFLLATNPTPEPDQTDNFENHTDLPDEYFECLAENRENCESIRNN